MQKMNKNFIVFLVVAVLFGVQAIPNQALAKAGFYVLSDKEDTSSSNTCTDNRPNPAPVVYTITPETVVKGSTSVTVIIKGANFLPCSEARFSGSARPTVYNNPTQLTMQLNANNLDTAGKYLVNVVNPGPGGGYSNAVLLTVTDGNATTTGAIAGTTTKKANTGSATTKPATVAKASTQNAQTGTVNGMETNNTSNLQASAINSNNSFLPDTLIEWLILIVLIYVGIKIFRKLSEENKELKHA